MLQPSRTIFIVTMLIAGTLILIGDWFLAHGTDRKRLVVTMAIFGVGLVGIGIFPGTSRDGTRCSRWRASSVAPLPRSCRAR